MSAAKYTFTDDCDTGLYKIASSELKFVVVPSRVKISWEEPIHDFAWFKTQIDMQVAIANNWAAGLLTLGALIIVIVRLILCQ